MKTRYLITVECERFTKASLFESSLDLNTLKRMVHPERPSCKTILRSFFHLDPVDLDTFLDMNEDHYYIVVQEAPTVRDDYDEILLPLAVQHRLSA